ncbi:hypothetical protein CCP3SC1AL1_160028 [Gammaproteobacteria bacterium]
MRATKESDLDALLRLESLFSSDRLNKRSLLHLLRRGQADLWVAETVGEVIGHGVVFYHCKRTSARLYSLIVLPEMQGQGIGHLLLAFSEDYAREKGKKGMVLEVWEDNVPAIRLYKRAGYQISKRLPEYYEDGTSALRHFKNFFG